MDILYIVGRDPDSSELLRLSLRSVARFASGVGRVVVAGRPPAWLAPEVSRVETREIGRGKFRRIAECCLAAITAGAVRGEFLLCHDDHFLCEPADLGSWPFLWRGCDLPERGARRTFRNAKYRESMEDTRERLIAARLPFRDCGEHCPQRMDAADAPRVREIFAASPGFDLASAFLNVRAGRTPRFPWTLRRDAKLSDYEPERASLGCFSIEPEAARAPGFRAWRDATLSARCRYEGKEQ